MNHQPPSSKQWILDCIQTIKGARIAILGDFCLDVYWTVLDSADELSIETGLPVQRVEEQRYSLGGAANVAANLIALGVAQVSAIGMVGNDPFGEKLVGLLEEIHVDTSRMVRDQSDWQTCVYVKRYLGGSEQNRIDFGSFNKPTSSTLNRLIKLTEEAVTGHDLLIVNQQIAAGLFRRPLIDAVNRIALENPRFKVIVDSRHIVSEFRDVSLKINAAEAMRLVGNDADVHVADLKEIALESYARFRKPIFITRGERGIIVADSDGIEEIPGIKVEPPIDIVGAGDTALAAIAAVISTDKRRRSSVFAAKFANIAATVTLKKLQTTGTASPEEIIAARDGSSYA